MYPILKLVLLAVAANCAPTTLIPVAASLAQPYYFITPQYQNQYQYQQLLKIQQPAAPAAITKIEKPKEQYVFLYPSIPQLPLVALRDEEGGQPDFWGGISNWFSEFSNNFNQMPTPAPAEESSSGSDSKLSEKNTESMEPILPASTMPLNINKQRLYLISSQPQFYGNFAALQPARISTPILPIEPLRARSTADTVSAENEKVEQPILKDIVEASHQPADVQAIQPLQLRSSIVEPLQRLEINQPQIPVANNEPAPGVAALQLARFLEEARSQDTTLNTGNRVNENDANKLRNEAKPSDEEPSIAQAKPSAIALSGKGGVSSSAPSATAVVGEGGLALASPSAISLSGDFQEDEEEERKKQTEPFGST